MEQSTEDIRQMLDDFAKKEATVTKNMIARIFGMSKEDCEDVYQEAFMVLWKGLSSHKVVIPEGKLNSYFLGICKNKAHELLRKQKKTVLALDDDMFEKGFSEDKIQELLLTFEPDASLREKKVQTVRQMVRKLPNPCNEILWGFIFEELSMKELAAAFHYTIGSMKVKKHRCQEKFRKSFIEKIQSFIG